MFVLIWIFEWSPLPERVDALILGLLVGCLLTFVEPALDIPDKIRANLKRRKA